MSRSRLDWDDSEFLKALTAELHRRLVLSALLILNRAKELLNVDGTGRKADGGLKYGANPSQPGEAPHKQTGRLLASVAFEISGLVARVGTNVSYGRLLEIGGHFVKARPWLGRAAKEVAGAIEAIWRKPMRGPRG